MTIKKGKKEGSEPFKGRDEWEPRTQRAREGTSWKLVGLVTHEALECWEKTDI